MAGTFASFNTALSALRYQRVVMDTASTNVANVGTEGYVRRRANGETVGAPTQAALWSRYEGGGDGVIARGISRMADPVLDARSRSEHANLSYLHVRQDALERFEEGIGEPGDNGVSAALKKFRAAFHDLANNPQVTASRTQVLTSANSLASSLHAQAANVAKEAAGQRENMGVLVTEVNTLASDLAETNRAIAGANLNGTDANTLYDQRDQLAQRLSELTGGTATLRSDGGFDVTVGGVALVTGQDAGTFEVATGATGGPVTYQITSGSGTTAVPTGSKGELGAVAELLTTTLPGYAAGLDAVAKDLADSLNAAHQAGYDKAGTAGGPLFAYDPADVAASLSVVVTDPAKVAASGVPGGNNDGSNATAMATAGSVESSYATLVTGLGSQVSSASRLTATQSALTKQVDSARDQLGGVSLDEEMVDLVSAQRAYEAASRVMSTVDSMLDTLINRTGLVGR